MQQLTARGDPTLDQWIEHRWIPEHASTLAKSTCQRYANVYECHIVESLGDVALGELTSRQPLYVARQLGHSLPVLFSTYAHLIDEYAERSHSVHAEAEIAKARAISCASEVRHDAS